jgi:hypothetical protein
VSIPSSTPRSNPLYTLLLGRYQQQAAHDPTVFELSHAFSGKQQVGALAQVLGRMPELVHLKLRNDDLDDWALEVRQGHRSITTIFIMICSAWMQYRNAMLRGLFWPFRALRGEGLVLSKR